jgi:hypothetical protein
MSGWHWFWTLVGFLVYIIVLIFLYFFKPFEDLFTLVINGLAYDNAVFWAVVIVAIAAFCAFHWRAFRIHVSQQGRIESMIMASLRGSTFTAILLCAGAALQAVLVLCNYLLQGGYALDGEFGRRILAVLALIALAAIFGVIFWLLRAIQRSGHARG